MMPITKEVRSEPFSLTFCRAYHHGSTLHTCGFLKLPVSIKDLSSSTCPTAIPNFVKILIGLLAFLPIPASYIFSPNITAVTIKPILGLAAIIA